MNNRSTSETGHYKNLASFKTLILAIILLLKYKPSRAALLPEALQLQLNEATDTMTRLDEAETAETAAAKARFIPFDELSSFSTQLVAGFESAVPDSNLLPKARTILARIQGYRIGKANNKTEETGAEAVAGEAPESGRQISVSQRSFDALLDHFDKLITLIQGEPAYTSNNTDMLVKSLREKFKVMTILNDTAKDAILTAELTRGERQEKLYTPITGLVPTALQVKKAVLNFYKANTLEYKTVAAIPFRTIIKK